MKQTILKYGLISGFVTTLLMVSTLPFENQIGEDKALYIGYTVLVLSFLLVYFGIRSYRDNVGNGHITFGRAFALGISITLITCICYVLAWEVIYFNFMHDYLDKHAAHEIEKARAAGATIAAIQAKAAEMARFKQQYDNLFYNAAITFTEPFPVGLLITLISAAVLRRKPQAQPS
jgi:hypothetical protein